MRTTKIQAVILLIFSGTAGATDYYVSPSGNDGSIGGQNAPWQSISRVNMQNYGPGDRILFQGGATFSGTIQFGSNAGGTPASPVILTSYGTGRATISNAVWGCVTAIDTGAIEIVNMNFTGVNRASNPGNGILLQTSGTGRFSHIHLTDVEVQQFNYGITGNASSGGGYDDIRLLRVKSHDNLNDGFNLWVSSNKVGTFTNVYVGYSEFFNNSGTPVPNPTGFGAWFNGTNGALVEYSKFYNNGGNSNGNYGFMTFSDSNVTVQFCEAYGNHTGGNVDGGGFDFDGGTQQSVIQYSYSHDNDGPGYYFYSNSGEGQAWSNNVMRYSISQNDGLKNGFGSLRLAAESAATPLANFDVYGMTVYAGASPFGATLALNTSWNAIPSGASVRNSILYSAGGAMVAALNPGNPGLTLQNNDYFSSGSFALADNGQNYSSFSAWHSATGRDPSGSGSDPMIQNPGGGTIGDASAYQLKAGSPMIDVGADLASLGINFGSQDYFGNSLPQGPRLDIGANEFKAAPANPPNSPRGLKVE